MPEYIEPSSDLGKIKQKLHDPTVSTELKKKMILGLHIKFWHTSRDDMIKFLRRGGYSNVVLELVNKVVPWMCKDCMKWRRQQTRPLHGITMSPHFNYRVQTDLWFIWDMTFVVFVDECIRYALTAQLHRKTADEWMTTAFDLWIKYFGPMWFLVSDQEGAVTSLSWSPRRASASVSSGTLEAATAIPRHLSVNDVSRFFVLAV